MDLDLLLVGPSLEPAWATRRDLPTDTGTLRVISREALIAMKALAGMVNPAVPTTRSETFSAAPSICRHMLMTRAPLGSSKSTAK